jgi:hypothetical protein
MCNQELVSIFHFSMSCVVKNYIISKLFMLYILYKEKDIK